MATLPDPAAFDWAGAAGWVTGAAGLAGLAIGVIWKAIQNAGKIADKLPAPQIDTKILTADTMAMDRLAGSVEANNTILSENNILRREEHADRTANRASLEANTKAMDALVFETRELRGEVRGLAFQLAKSSK